MRCENGHERHTCVSHIVRGSGCKDCLYPVVGEQHAELADHLAREEDKEQLLDERTSSSALYTFTCPDTGVEKQLSVHAAVTLLSAGKPLIDTSTYIPVPEEYMVNGVDYPAYLPKFSKRVLPWTCPAGHIWETQAGNVIGRGRLCPYCENRELLKGFNDLATFSPGIEEWMPSASPFEVLMKTHLRQTLTCPACAASFAYTFSRNYQGSGQDRNKPVCPKCSYGDEKRITLETVSPLAYQWYSRNNPDSADEVNVQKSVKREFVCDEGHVFTKRMDSIKLRRGISCPHCRSTSGELWLKDLIKANYDGEIVYNSRTVLDDGRELDVYLPEKKIAFEFNGVWWHCEHMITDKDYHRRKWSQCREKEIQLITIWEDTYHAKRSLLEQMILYKIGVSGTKGTYARATQVDAITYHEAEHYLDKHHIQGASTGTFYLGLLSHGELVAASVWKHLGDELRLERYASHKNVVGGLGKLLSHVLKNDSLRGDARAVATFSDNSVSDGSLYEKLGFECVKEWGADYSYLVGEQRMHKFGYRKERFRRDPALTFEEGATEHQLALLNSIPRIWDCGKRKWEYPLK